MTGAGAWVSPAWYGRGMPLPADAAGKRRARLAMAGVQRVLIDQGLMPDTVKLDGGAGPLTYEAIIALQLRWGLPRSGQFRRREAFCLWLPICWWWQVEMDIPDNLVVGLIGLESGFDPGAEGRVDPRDRGLGQFNSRWWPTVPDERAYSDPASCISLVAHNLAAQHERLGSWDAAVAAHNNPAKAAEWARTGKAPDEQIARYVRLVRRTAGRPI